VRVRHDARLSQNIARHLFHLLILGIIRTIARDSCTTAPHQRHRTAAERRSGGVCRSRTDARMASRAVFAGFASLALLYQQEISHE
jgi:hypothetical protein